MENPENSQAVYFTSLTLENVKCFKGKHHIPLTNAKGEWAQWTVILGNNGTGKTTALKCLESLKAEGANEVKLFKANPTFNDGKQGYLYPSMLYFRPSMTWINQEFSELKISAKLSKKDLKWGYRISSNVESEANYSFLFSEDNNFYLDVFFISSKRDAYDSTSESKSPVQVDNFLSNILNPKIVNSAEKWLLELYTAKSNEAVKDKILPIFSKVEKIVIDILPDVHSFELHTNLDGTKVENYILFETDFGKVRLEEMGYGYQTSLAWIMDLARRMFERYPEAENPLEQPAVVLVDELDLHLHPQWQRKIINHLSKHFPKTQFIVTAHSPLLVQSAEDINVIVLQKNEEGVSVKPFDIHDFRGWSVEEILRELMELEDKVHSDLYLELMDAFVEGLNEDDYLKTKNAYDKLCQILHPTSPLRSTLDIQMISLTRPLS